MVLFSWFSISFNVISNGIFTKEVFVLNTMGVPSEGIGFRASIFWQLNNYKKTGKGIIKITLI